MKKKMKKKGFSVVESLRHCVSKNTMSKVRKLLFRVKPNDFCSNDNIVITKSTQYMSILHPKYLKNKKKKKIDVTT